MSFDFTEMPYKQHTEYSSLFLRYGSLLPPLDRPVGLLQEGCVGGGGQAGDHAAPEPERVTLFVI